MPSRSQSNDVLLLTACASTLATLVPVLLRQTGAISNLSDPLADTNAIAASPTSHPRGIPGSIFALARHTITLGLALAAQKSPVARKWLGASVVLNSVASAYELTLQAVVFREVSTYAAATAALTGLTVYAARKPVVEALRIAAHDATVIVDTI